LEGTDRLAAVEPLLRVVRADPNTGADDDEVTGITPGVQIIFQGRNKLSLNLDLVSFSDKGTASERSFKAQFQAYF
jgi:hypothetical protein